MLTPKKENILWALFAYTILVVILDVYMNLSGFENVEWINILTLTAPVILLVFHSLWTIGLIKSALLIVGAGVMGWLGEFLGLESGILFGGEYSYHPNKLGDLVLGVPVLVPIFWGVYYYTGFWMTEVFTLQKSRRLASKVALDVLFVVLIDLFMDPLFVHEGFWSWTKPGAYFNVPIGNFIGWALVTAVISFVLRSTVLKGAQLEKSSAVLIPISGYIALGITFMVCALSIQMVSLAIFGFFLMVPVGVLNIWKYKASN